MATLLRKRHALGALALGLMIVPGFSTADTWRFFTSVDGGMPPNAIAITDLNHDGQPDIVVTTEIGGEGRVAVMLWRPKVHYDRVTYFQVTYLPMIAHPLALATGDFDNDNNQDVAVAFSLETGGARGGVVILFGDGTGGFREERHPVLFTQHNTSRPLDMVAGSLVSGSALIDLAVTISDNANENFVAILLNHLNFAERYVNTITARNSIVVFSTFANPDLFVASDRISRLVGAGDGTFSDPTDFWCPGDGSLGAPSICTVSNTISTLDQLTNRASAAAPSSSLHLGVFAGPQRFLAFTDQATRKFTAFHRRPDGGFDGNTTIQLDGGAPKRLFVQDIGSPQSGFFTADDLPDAVMLNDDDSVTAAFQTPAPPFFGPRATISNHFCASVALAAAAHNPPPDSAPPLPFIAVTGQRCPGPGAATPGDYGMGGEGGCPPLCQKP